MVSAMAEGWEEMAAISAMWLLRNFQATKERMAVIATILATVTICCLENRLVRPDSGLRRLNCGCMGLRLRIQPPASMPDSTAAAVVTAATPREIFRPRLPMDSMRSIIRAGVLAVCASNASCWASAMRRCWIRGSAPISIISAPVPRMARWDRSRERAPWPSERVFCSLRSVAGRFLSWLESMAQ
ncbi:hypothetical protein GY15_20375 [Delftia sp. 670]|nr:MAG: hypothetical protein GAK34_02123 [Delftia tsuruhatensis]KEH12453.1 hypothetical protein GY15_20375 [Delftia sp. 670]